MTSLTEALPYYIALQPKFREAMGMIRFGDWVHFKGGVGPVTDRQVNQGNGREYSIINAGFGWIEEQYLDRLPLSIDPRNPERGLWGMVDWEMVDAEINHCGQIYVHPITNGHRIPELALLKALAHQEGVMP